MIQITSGSKIASDCLLVYTIQTTSDIYSGASVSVNGIKIADLVAQKANNQFTIVGSIRVFKGDVVSVNISTFGGNASMVAYY